MSTPAHRVLRPENSLLGGRFRKEGLESKQENSLATGTQASLRKTSAED